MIWQQEEGVYGKLTQPFQIGEGMCGPTVMAFGSEDAGRFHADMGTVFLKHIGDMLSAGLLRFL